VKIAVVLGTRPEAIKLAPVVHCLDATEDVDCLVVSTGQHRELLDPMLALFRIQPDVELDAMQPNQRLAELTSELVRRLAKTFRDEQPDWVLVQGDTTTTFCGALAAFYEGVPVGHVEAGLRTHDLRSPFPEEANRTLTGTLASLHFCPTRRNAANLLRQGVAEAGVRVTGNTGIDALLWAAGRAKALPCMLPQTRPRRILLTLHRRESHGDPIRRLCHAVTALAARGDTEIVFPVHANPAVRDVVVAQLSNVPGVRLCEPLDYLTLVQVLTTSDLVLTDSGGLQEEAPALGKPVLVLRETTERGEAVDAGVAQLVGTDPTAVLAAATRLLDDPDAYAAMAHAENPFGDGTASFAVVDALLERASVRVAA
jgi:UDP-N-acetylglucosamine 2-epimerase (non-hydrolysing)